MKEESESRTRQMMVPSYKSMFMSEKLFQDTIFPKRRLLFHVLDQMHATPLICHFPLVAWKTNNPISSFKGEYD